MDIQRATKQKGGSCENPYGGHFRLDKFDLLGTRDGRSDPLEMVLRQVITNAVSSYVYFGLGANGYVADEFLMAHAYFFEVESTKPSSWNPDRRVLVSDIRPGASRKDPAYIDLTDNQMADGCFDRHWEMSGLDRAMSISTFRRLLRKKRRNIIESNLEQVRDYLRSLRDQAAGRGEYMKPGQYHGDLLETLVSPTDEALASLLYPVRQVAQVSHRRSFRMPRRIYGRRDRNALRAASPLPVMPLSATIIF